MAKRPISREVAENEPPGWLTLLKILIVLPLMTGVFVVIWAFLNFGWGTALEKFITPGVFSEPCQRLAATTTPLTRYAPRETSRRGRLISMARCHFGEQETIVYEPVWEREFATREFWLLLVIYGLGLMACLIAALFCTFQLFFLGQRAISILLRRRDASK